MKPGCSIPLWVCAFVCAAVVLFVSVSAPRRVADGGNYDHAAWRQPQVTANARLSFAAPLSAARRVSGMPGDRRAHMKNLTAKLRETARRKRSG